MPGIKGLIEGLQWINSDTEIQSSRDRNGRREKRAWQGRAVVVQSVAHAFNAGAGESWV